MLKTSLKGLLQGKLEGKTFKHYIYLVRDRETVFYVGKSLDPVRRIYEHLGWDRGEKEDKSELGRLIIQNLPKSLHWKIELLKLRDCEFEVAKIMVKFTQSSEGMLIEDFIEEIEKYRLECEINLDGAMRWAETAFILFYHPCLNKQRNYFPSPVPTRYLSIKKNKISDG